MQVRIADDGEILVQGGNVCTGYFHDPAATAELIDDDGWMHSGDVGRFDADGYLTVTGRKKDLIITAAGQNIAPQEIESDLRQHELISEAVVVGEGRRYLTALLDARRRRAHRLGRRRTTRSPASRRSPSDPDLRAEIDTFVDHVNSKRSRVENIRKYRILAPRLHDRGRRDDADAEGQAQRRERRATERDRRDVRRGVNGRALLTPRSCGRSGGGRRSRRRSARRRRLRPLQRGSRS